MADEPRDPASRRRGLVAEFATGEGIIGAARALSERGYTRLDAFVPRPLEELEDIIVPQRSTLPRTVFFGGVVGACAGLGTEWFCNAWDFPLNVGGRPPFSLPAFIPITFEIMVLFGSLTAFIGVLHRMRLPRLYDPLFEVPNFDSASIDRFWLYVAADDPKFRSGELESLLQELGSAGVHWTGHAAFAPSAPEEPEPEPPHGAPAAKEATS